MQSVLGHTCRDANGTVTVLNSPYQRVHHLKVSMMVSLFGVVPRVETTCVKAALSAIDRIWLLHLNLAVALVVVRDDASACRTGPFGGCIAGGTAVANTV